MFKPELLAPAGNLRNLHYALAYGADAVYAGQPRYSLRVRNNDFDKLTNLANAIEITHHAGKKFYLAVNILPHNSKLKTFINDLNPIVALKPDGLIMADVGLIMLAREQWPDMAIHLSVQANTMNYAGVRFWQQLGLQRVILSRELSLDELAEIRQLCPDMELEVFVHGALCIAYSGRCLLSGYMNHRDPNQGTCTNACRWEYKLHPASCDQSGDIVAQPQLGIGSPQTGVFLLEEKMRPQEFMPVFEDEHGTYIMNSKDLRAVQHVARLVNMGIDSLKIEGRTKSHYYVARSTQVYRRAIDDAIAERPFNMELMTELDKLANRGYTEGFYRRHVHDEYQNYLTGSSVRDKQIFVGEILHYDIEQNLHLVDVKNKFSLGDSLELMLPQANLQFTLDIMLDKNHQAITVAAGSGHQVWVRLPQAGELNQALLLQNLT